MAAAKRIALRNLSFHERIREAWEVLRPVNERFKEFSINEPEFKTLVSGLYDIMTGHESGKFTLETLQKHSKILTETRSKYSEYEERFDIAEYILKSVDKQLSLYSKRMLKQSTNRVMDF